MQSTTECGSEGGLGGGGGSEGGVGGGGGDNGGAGGQTQRGLQSLQSLPSLHAA